MGEIITITDDNADNLNVSGRATGLVPRNFKSHPPGYLPFAAVPPSSILIPEGQWDALIAQQEAEQSSLQHLADFHGVDSLDQNGQGYSHTEDTEVLTEKGFVQWPDYNGTDLLASVNQSTGLMEFQAPTERHAYEYRDEMFYSTNRRLDFGVTRNHRMFVRKWDEQKRTLSNQYTMQRADQLGWYVGMMPAPRGFIGTELVEVAIPDDRSYDGDDFLAMISLIVSDGYASQSFNHLGQVSFCCFNEARYPAVAALASRIGFKEQPSRKGVWCRYSAYALSAWVRANCYTGGLLGARNKSIPAIVKCASMRQIAHFVAFFGDKTHNAETVQFYSTSKKVIDDLQELHLRISKRGTIGHVGPRSSIVKTGVNAGHVISGGESWVLTVGKEDRLSIERKKHIETDAYKGLVYCATVPNGTLVTRRNGSILISGNCWAYSTTAATMLIRIVQGLEHEPLSGHMIGCIIKGYRDEGGWNAQSLEFARTTGIASQKLWPQGSMSRSNDTPAMRADAAKRKVTEWWDLPEDRTAAKQYLASLLLRNIPVMIDLNWWGHSVCAVRLMKRDPFTVRIRNSWANSWGDRGYGDLVGSKAVPDGAAAPRVTVISQ